MNYIIVNAVMNMSESVLVKYDIDYYCSLSNCIIILTAMTEISWYVCVHACECLLRYADAIAPFFTEESFISATVT